jgi:hypothetical protein
LKVSTATGKIEHQIEMFLHTIRGSLFLQPMKYQILTSESVVVGIGMTRFLGKKLRGRSGGPPD